MPFVSLRPEEVAAMLRELAIEDLTNSSSHAESEQSERPKRESNSSDVKVSQEKERRR